MANPGVLKVFRSMPRSDTGLGSAHDQSRAVRTEQQGPSRAAESQPRRSIVRGVDAGLLLVKILVVLVVVRILVLDREGRKGQVTTFLHCLTVFMSRGILKGLG